MLDGLSFDVVGNRVILDNLDALDETIVAKVDDALEKAADVGLITAEDHAAVRTGFMRSRLFVEVRDHQIVLGDDAPYAGFVELGTYKMAPQPFLVPGALMAADELKKQLEGML